MVSSLVLNWLIGPALMFALAWIFLADLPEYRTGLIIVGLARCIAMVLIWNDLACGDREAAAVLVAINSVFQVLAFGALGWFYLQAAAVAGWACRPPSAEFSIGAIVLSVLMFLGIPLIAGFLTRVFGERAKGSDLVRGAVPARRSDPWALYGLLFTIVLLFALQGDAILIRPVGRRPHRRAAADLLRSHVPRCVPARTRGRAELREVHHGGLHRRGQQLRARHRGRHRDLRHHLRSGARRRRRPADRGPRARRPRLRRHRNGRSAGVPRRQPDSLDRPPRPGVHHARLRRRVPSEQSFRSPHGSPGGRSRWDTSPRSRTSCASTATTRTRSQSSRVRVPGLGMQQKAAGVLIAAILAIFVPTGAYAATAAPVESVSAISAVSTTTSAFVFSPPEQPDTTQTEEDQTERVIRSGDTLWSIAEDEYGEGERYTEIFEASTSIAQPGGERLTDPDLILPGWTVDIPSATSAPAASTQPASSTEEQTQDSFATATGSEEAPAPVAEADAAAADEDTSAQDGSGLGYVTEDTGSSFAFWRRIHVGAGSPDGGFLRGADSNTQRTKAPTVLLSLYFLGEREAAAAAFFSTMEIPLMR